MKKPYPVFVLFLLFSGFFVSSFGQTDIRQFTPYDNLPEMPANYKPSYSDHYPQWAKMLYHYPVNYHEVEEGFEQYEKKHPGEETPIMRYFKIWSRVIEPYVLADATIQIPDVKVLEKNIRSRLLNIYRQEKKGTAEDPSEWSFLGPKVTHWTAGDSHSGVAPWQANVYSFDVAPTNDSVLYCGTETGFVNKTVDRGLTWQQIGRDYPFGGSITAVAIDPGNENIVYVAGGGQIHKSTDGGDTWTPMLTTSFHADRLKIDPANPLKLVAAAREGTFISDDGGVTWSKKIQERTYDVDFRPGDSNHVFAISVHDATGNYHVWESTDGGNTFPTPPVYTFTGTPNQSGALMAVSPANPAVMYIALLAWENTDKVNAYPYIYRGSYNATSDKWNFYLKKKGEDTGLGGFSVGQGYFDFVLEASPDDINTVFFGTCSLWKSTDGGTTYEKTGGYGGKFEIHPDIQDLKLLPGNKAWVSTDGGMSYTIDNFYLSFRTYYRVNGLVGSDFWGFDQGWNEDIAVGGRYHNGNTAVSDMYGDIALRLGGAESPTGWVIKGVQRHVAFDDIGGRILPKSADDPVQGSFIFSKYPNMDQYGGLRGNMVQHPWYYNLVYLGEENGFWISRDMGVTFDLLYSFPGRVRYLDVSYKNPSVFYADVDGYGLYRSDNGGETWTRKPSLTSGSYGNSSWNGRLFFVISPYNENVIYACLENGAWSSDIGKVFRSADGGDTWTNWTGSVDAYMKGMAIQPTTDGKDLVYLFTKATQGKPGTAYFRKEGTDDWSTFSNQYPASFSVNIGLPFFRDSKIRIGGNGGVWESPLAEPDFTPVITPMVQTPTLGCTEDTLSFNDHSILNHEGVSWHWDFSPAPEYVSNPDIRSPKVVPGQTGSFTVTLTVTKNNQTYSRTINNMVYVRSCPSLDDCDNPAEIPTSQWKKIYVDSEHSGRPAENAWDGDINTFWHTEWYPNDPPHPHEVQVDMSDTFNIHKFVCVPRQDSQNGRIAEYKLYFSNDKDNWGDPVSTGTWENTAAPQVINFPSPVSARYFRLVALSEVNGNPWTSVAEISLTGCYYVQEPNAVHTLKIQELKAFPVPANDVLNIPLPPEDHFTYTTYSLTGKVIDRGTLESAGTLWNYNVSGFEPGTYLIRLVSPEKTVYRIKMVKIR